MLILNRQLRRKAPNWITSLCKLGKSYATKTLTALVVADLVDISFEDGEKAGNTIIESYVKYELKYLDDLK